MAKSKDGKPQRIVWAVDPFEGKSDTGTHVVEVLRELTERGSEVQPVYVLSPDEYDLNIEFNAPWLKQIRPTTEKVLEHSIKEIGIKGLLSPQVIIEKRPSQRKAVDTLVSYAKRTKADSILVGTHAKKGISRFFLGSFAETLLLHSKMPVLVVGPHSEIPHAGRKTSRILFSTDFGTSSLSTFKSVITLAKTLEARIILFHCLSHPVEPVFQSGVYLLGGSYLPFPEFVTRDQQTKKQLAESYVKLARKLGVTVEVRINSGHENTAKAITDQAEIEKSDLIAMAAESGAVAAALIGSVTRQVVRIAPCPVWVLRVSGT